MCVKPWVPCRVVSKDKDHYISVFKTLKVMGARAKECPLAHYKPHAGQREFHSSLVDTVLIMCGNRFGKTHCAMAEAIATLLGYRPWLVEGFQMKRTPRGELVFPSRDEIPTSAWVMRTDGIPIELPSKIAFVTGLPIKHGIGEILEPKFRELWPEGAKFHAKNGNAGVWDKLQLPNGSTAFFGSSSQPNLSWEGFHATKVLADEPIRRSVYVALKRGLIDTNGQFMWPMTPLGGSEMAWVAADLVEAAEGVHIIRGSSYDNPFNDPAALTKFFNQTGMSEEEKRARMHGDLAVLGYRIVTTFDANAVVEPTTIPRDVQRILVVDPHHSKPHVCIWAAVIGSGEDRQYLIYRESPTDDFTKMGAHKESLQEFHGRLKTLEGREDVIYRICDPQFGRQKAKVLGVQYPSFVDQMATFGMAFDTRVDNDVERGIQQLKDAFEPSNVTGKPRVLISENCKNTIKALKLWSYETKETGELKPSEQFKDFADVVRYLVQSNPPVDNTETQSYLEYDDDDDGGYL